MGYPPDHHLLRDLCEASIWTGEMDTRFIGPLTPWVADEHGSMAAGPLFALADLAAASTSIAGADGDWVGTLDLSVRMSDAVRTGPLVIEGSVVRAGGTLITVRSELYDGEGTEEPRRYVGMTIGGFRRMPRNTDYNPDSKAGPNDVRVIGARQEWARGESRLNVPVLAAVGARELAPGLIELDKSPYVTNSFGTINGGTTGIIICAGAESLLGGGPGGPWAAVDVDVRYIGQAKAGPVRTRCELLRRGDDHATVEVMVEDQSQHGRAIAAGLVLAARVG